MIHGRAIDVRAGGEQPAAMSKPPPELPSELPPGPKPRHVDRARAEREARQAAALRANRRRRKAQARGRETAAPDDPAARPDAEGPEDAGQG